LTGGEVSESAIRTYLGGQTPRLGKAITLARLFGPEAGAELLRRWDYDDVADDFKEDYEAGIEDLSMTSMARAGPRPNRIEYDGEPLSYAEQQIALAFIDLLRQRDMRVRTMR
jgi:hypothetical protein